MLSVENLSFSYNGIPILKNIAFQVSTGNLVAICGVNGAGKTTLLKTINGILKPCQGSAFLDKRDLNLMSPRERARQIAWIPQKSPDTGLSVFDVILLGKLPQGSWKPSSNDYKDVEHIIKKLDLTDMAHRPFNKLSGGEAQKVIIARALIQKPRLLLCDEPTNHLDLKNQLEVMDIIRSYVKEQNIIALVAIHDLNLALRFCDELLFMKNGYLHSKITPAEISEAIVEDVYGVNVTVVNHPDLNTTFLIPSWRKGK